MKRTSATREFRQILICSVMCLCLLGTAGAQDASVSALLSAEGIVKQMVIGNQKRAEGLKSYTGIRNYQLIYTGIPGKKEAQLSVKACYEAPDKKQFLITAQTGSGFIINKVLKRLLESEQEAATEEQKARTALTDKNYNFELLGEDALNGRPAYVLRVSPKSDNKFLYRGRVWVDAKDFAVVKIEAEPSKRPSFWISKTKISQTYAQSGEFWLPLENKSTSDVRLGGTATLTISYNNYSINVDASHSCSQPNQSNSGQGLETSTSATVPASLAQVELHNVHQ